MNAFRGREICPRTLGNERGRVAHGIFAPRSLRSGEQLSDEIDELRPRWADGTGKLIARNFSQHVADLNCRGEAIGGRQQFTQLSE